jgi:hypothetical protein
MIITSDQGFKLRSRIVSLILLKLESSKPDDQNYDGRGINNFDVAAIIATVDNFYNLAGDTISYKMNLFHPKYTFPSFIFF